jgi:hypothetical protein
VWQKKIVKGVIMLNLVALNPTAYKNIGLKPAPKPLTQQSVIQIQFGASENTANDVDYKALAQQTSCERRGNSISGRVLFRLETDQPIPGLDTYKLQEACGYHPMGYDHFGGQTQQFDAKLNKYVTTFSCAASCD